MFTRKIYPAVKKHLASSQITVITGMRRVGKTTLVKSLLKDLRTKNKIYLDLERLDLRELFQTKNYDNVLNFLRQQGINTKQKMYIALDEIQLVPNIASILKYLHDNDDYQIKFIATGSSSYYLKNLFTESLAGRKKIFTLHTLDFGEFLTFKKITFAPENFLKTSFDPTEYERLRAYYEEFINYGGFPEVALTEIPEEKEDLLFDILNSYINIDVRALSDFKNIDNLNRLLKVLVPRVANRLDYSKLASLSGLNRATVKNYLDFLEKTYFISRVSVFTKSPDREIVKAQKLYFEDNGFLKILGDANSGAIFENAIFNQLKHLGSLQYYARKNGLEIDFILDQKIALEIKETPVNQDQKNLSNLAKNIGLNNFHLIGRFTSPKFADFIWGGKVFA